MSAHNSSFPWLTYKGKYDFFEQRMQEHNKVESYEKIKDGLYEILLTNSKTLIVFICDCYSYGIAEYEETHEKYGKLDAVIINSNWCGYSLELKHNCMQKKIGIFDIRGFMLAIRKDEFWTYLTDDEKKQFKKNEWL